MKPDSSSYQSRRVDNAGNQISESFGIYDPSGSPAGSSNAKRSRSGITTGDYFVIKNTFIGSSTSGVTGIRTTSSGPEIVGVGTEFVDNVYFAEHVVSVGSSVLRVFANVQSISGINTVGFATFGLPIVGNYSWGAINVSRGVNSKSFEFFNQNGISGIETSAQVIRSLPVKTSYT